MASTAVLYQRYQHTNHINQIQFFANLVFLILVVRHDSSFTFTFIFEDRGTCENVLKSGCLKIISERDISMCCCHLNCSFLLWFSTCSLGIATNTKVAAYFASKSPKYVTRVCVCVCVWCDVVYAALFTTQLQIFH